MVNWPDILTLLIGGGVTFVFAFIFHQQFINYRIKNYSDKDFEKMKKDLNEAFAKIRKLEIDWQSPLGNYNIKD